MERTILRGALLVDGSGAAPGRGPRGRRRADQAGADVIKLFATGGAMTPGVEPSAAQLTLDEVRAAIEEARKAGRRTARDGVALVPPLVAPEAIANGGVAAGIPGFAVRKSLDLRDRHVESFQIAMRLGVTIAAGTLNAHGSMVRGRVNVNRT